MSLATAHTYIHTYIISDITIQSSLLFTYTDKLERVDDIRSNFYDENNFSGISFNLFRLDGNIFNEYVHSLLLLTL